MDSLSEEVSTPKRAPRKRASGAAAVREPKQKNTSRKRTVDRVRSVETPSPSVERKAPTIFGDCQLSKRKRQRHMMVMGAILLVGIGGSAAIGFSDKGQIDVQKTIEDRNERIRTNTTDARDIINSRVEVPVQNTNNAGKVDGGLKGRAPGEVVEKPAPVAVATTTATSSDQTASSTEVSETSTTTTAVENTEMTDDSEESSLDS